MPQENLKDGGKKKFDFFSYCLAQFEKIRRNEARLANDRSTTNGTNSGLLEHDSAVSTELYDPDTSSSKDEAFQSSG